MRRVPMLVVLGAGLAAGWAGFGRTGSAKAAEDNRKFQAGAAVVDIAPPAFPVRVNGMFTERMADKVVDPLHAKALVLDDGGERVALCVVDTCMMDRELIDRAKELASKSTGIKTDRMLVSATHTHSAPSAMGCLGSRMDPGYAAFLPGKIAEAIVAAAGRMEPARVAWTSTDAWNHTFNRRWIRRPDRVLNDPFGAPTVRAQMHPGHQSADVTGPSGPVDPGLTLLAVQTPEGRPLAVLANYSMHYIGSELLSSDYFGKFAGYLGRALGAGPEFVALMSQGTSGDLWAGDYGAPARPLDYDVYAREMADLAARALTGVEWREGAPLRMAESVLELRYRVPDDSRLAWARGVVAGVGDRLPQTQPEIYAQEAIYLHDRQRTELKLQALGVGELGITAIPNEVVALTGLKLKARSPFPITMNIELANGAEGYIPSPEQHALGGYITWPARTAGLEVTAEPKIVETVLGLLERVAGRARRPDRVEDGPYAQAVRQAGPMGYWRFEDMEGPVARDSGPDGREAGFEKGVALYLPGAGSGEGVSPQAALTPSAFSGGAQINRAVHLAGGRVRTRAALGDRYSVSLWVWNALPADARPVAGYVFSRGADADGAARGEHLGIGGTHRADLTGRLFLFNGNERDEAIAGRTVLAQKAWHQVVLVREGARVRVHLDGNPVPEIDAEFAHTVPAGVEEVFFGGRNDGMFGLEGKLDEVALFSRVLSPDEIAALHQASGQSPPVVAVAPQAPTSAPISPLESLAKIHVRDGYGVELVASEPLIMDPVAIDWDSSGRLWVVEMADYPLGMDGQGKPGGRVRVLEDTDGDGRYDRSALFADGLSFPTGLLTWRDGVIVAAAPEILFLRDTDGDGRADGREVLVTGLLQGNQQLRANGLRWGLDNWVYCAAGGHHGEYGVGNKLRSERSGIEVEVGSRDFRFRPDSGELEPESGPSQFGRNRDDWGHWYGTQNSRPLWHYVLADRYLRRNPHVAAPDPTKLVVVPLNPKVWPVSPQEKRYHSFEQGGHFTSACSGMIYTDSLLFPGDERHAFTCEPFHNVVQRNVVVDDGVSFSFRRAEGEERQDFFASEDRWCRPVMTRTGPDGALWVVDMYRYMIEHPDWLPQEGKAELLPHYRLGEDKGRLYRVFPSGVNPRPIVPLETLDTPALVAALDSPNGWQRDKGHQMLLWRADPAAEAPLVELATHSSNPLVRLQALCVLDGLGLLTPERLRPALSHPHPGVRANALRLAESRGTPEIIAAAAALERDPDMKVRLQLACTLGEWSDPAAGAALGRVAAAGPNDPFLVAAVLSSAVPHLPAVAGAVALAAPDVRSAYAGALAAQSLATNNRIALAALLSPAVRAAESSGTAKEARFAAVAEFLKAVRTRGGDPDAMSQGEDELARLLKSVPALVPAAAAVARDTSAPLAEREAAVSLLLGVPPDRHAGIDILLGWLTATQPVDVQTTALRLLAATGDDRVPGALLAAWPTLTPDVRAAAFDALVAREAWALAFLNDATGLAATLDAGRRDRLLKHPAPAVRSLAESRLTPSAARDDVLARFKPSLTLEGDAARGREVHARLCAGCHRLGDIGRDVGPNLASVASHPPEKLLTNILAPNVDVQPGYFAYQCRLKDGTDVFGLLAAETGNSLGFTLPDGSRRTVLRSDIADLRSAAVSLMPEGLEAALSLQDMADLIRFLKQGGAAASGAAPSPQAQDLRVGASAVALKAEDSMPLAGYLESRFTNEQEGELRATAVVVEAAGQPAVALVTCDVLWVTRGLTDPALAEIERTTGLRPDNVLINATHTHHAPGVAPAHAFGWSPEFADEVRRGIVRAVQEAHQRLVPASLFFEVGEERTIGANSRLRLPGRNISWLNPMAEAGRRVEPTGPFDPQLPVMDFRNAAGGSIALLFNHSTHTIGTRSGRDVRSPSFYGLAAQELEPKLGAVVGFIEGASGSTHNIRGVTTPLAIERLKQEVWATREKATRYPVTKVAALRDPFHFRVRRFTEAEEDASVSRYLAAHAPQNADRIRQIFADQRRVLATHQGTRRTTWIQVIRIGDIALVGVPAEYFTGLGLDIKRRSPFKHTLVAELANDWIGYLPDKAGHILGGYQTWTGLHSYAEPGTGERVANEVVQMLHRLAD